MNSEDSISTVKASHRLDVSLRTVRHFCDRGYIPHIRRNARYQRVLTPEQFELLAILVQMKQSGFTNSEIKRYSRLYRQGDATVTERLAILTTRKHQLQQEIKARQTAIDFIERQEEMHGSTE